jgi:acetyl esterase
VDGCVTKVGGTIVWRAWRGATKGGHPGAGCQPAARARAAAGPRSQHGQGLALRLYRPALEPRPAVLYLHGGGFVMGDLDSHDDTCRRLAKIADVMVLALDYRLAPEHPGPAAVVDAVAAFGWARQRLQELGGDPAGGLAVAGDSAGGALAVLAAVRLHAEGMTPSALLLAYPNADMTLHVAPVSQEGDGPGREADDLCWLVEQWLGDPERADDPGLSPAHADLTGLPATLLATAEHDLLRDEGQALARQLREVGPTCSTFRMSGWCTASLDSPISRRRRARPAVTSSADLVLSYTEVRLPSQVANQPAHTRVETYDSYALHLV